MPFTHFISSLPNRLRKYPLAATICTLFLITAPAQATMISVGFDGSGVTGTIDVEVAAVGGAITVTGVELTSAPNAQHLLGK